MNLETTSNFLMLLLEAGLSIGLANFLIWQSLILYEYLKPIFNAVLIFILKILNDLLSFILKITRKKDN